MIVVRDFGPIEINSYSNYETVGVRDLRHSSTENFTPILSPSVEMVLSGMTAVANKIWMY